MKKIIVLTLHIMLFYFMSLFLFQQTDLYNQETIEKPGLFLRFRLEQIVKMPCYQKKYGVTYCNVLARDTLDPWHPWALGKVYGFWIDDFNYDITPVFGEGHNIFISISEAYLKAKYAASLGKITSLTMRQAQSAANRGELVWGISAKYNHEFLVCPDFSGWHNDLGCLVAQAGEVNGVMYISDYNCFGNRWRDREIKFYLFPKIGEKSNG